MSFTQEFHAKVEKAYKEAEEAKSKHKGTKEIFMEIARPSCFGDSETIIDCERVCGMVGECARENIKKLLKLGVMPHGKTKR
jgi:hypothetical protein